MEMIVYKYMFFKERKGKKYWWQRNEKKKGMDHLQRV